MKPLWLWSRGETPYREGLALQGRVQEAQRAGEAGDLLLLLEHPPVVTLGRIAGRKHLLVGEEALEAAGVELWEADRGGDITYHGPGQLVGYALLRLEGAWRDVRKYVHGLEEVLIQALRPWGLEGKREAGRPGVWLEGKRGLCKIAALGIHLSRWQTRHGFALNIAPRLEPFGFIVPCGLEGAGVTSMEEALGGEAPSRAVLEPCLVEAFCEVFGYSAIARWEEAETAGLAGEAERGVP